jgi:hypothetical protein
MMKKIFLFVAGLIFVVQLAYNQKLSDNGQLNIVQTAVPFLTIAPDSRSGAMGDAGVATSPDVNSQHWNPAKYPFMKDKIGGVSFTYTPWLSNLVSGINLLYISGFKKIGERNAVSGSLTYFSLGDIDLTNDQGTTYSTTRPYEFALDGAYSRLFSEKFSGALAFRYIYSALAKGAASTEGGEKAGWSVAADVAAYYRTNLDIQDKKSTLAFGADISNMGRKISYNENQPGNFIPINMRLGTALTTDLDDFNSLTATVDFNKLLVPTPTKDSTFADGSKAKVLDPSANVSVPAGMFQSFSDAPGGFKEELHEVTYSIGMEYWYRKQFALRAGYFHEAADKGNRRYYTAGAGLRLNVFILDFSYLIPAYQNNNPLAHTLRFSLTFEFDSPKATKKKSKR